MSTERNDGPACVAVACSGGRDSIALLHATVSAARDVPGLTVFAFHVHHGLSTKADEWFSHVEGLCLSWAALGWPVRFVGRKVVCRPDGRGVEAVAREARYAALAEMSVEVGASLVLLAHHRQDQAETVLLQALRGGSLAGMAAMPGQAWRQGVCWARPWLHRSRAEVEAYVAAYALPYVDDDSNADERFARNRLRRAVWPAVVRAFPGAESALADGAARLGDAREALDELLALRLAQMVQADGALDAAAWAQQRGALRRLTLAAWWRGCTGGGMSVTWVTRLAEEVPALLGAQDASAVWAPLGLTLYRGLLRHEGAYKAASREGAHGADLAAGEALVSFTQAGGVACAPWRGRLVAEPVTAKGVALSCLQGLLLQPRSGGERFQMGPGRPARSLKKQFQQAGVPAWARQAPLVWQGAQLVFVPGLGMDARCWAPEGQAQWALRWEPFDSDLHQ